MLFYVKIKTNDKKMSKKSILKDMVNSLFSEKDCNLNELKNE